MDELTEYRLRCVGYEAEHREAAKVLGVDPEEYFPASAAHRLKEAQELITKLEQENVRLRELLDYEVGPHPEFGRRTSQTPERGPVNVRSRLDQR